MATTTNYVNSYEKAIQVFSKVKTKDKGRPLCSSGYIRLFQQDDKFLVTVGKFNKEWHSGEDLVTSPETHLYSITPDNIITNLINAYSDDPTSKIGAACDMFNQTVKGWWTINPYRYITLSQPGHWHSGKHPVFTGFKMHNHDVLTPVVASIEDEMTELKLKLGKRNKILRKQMKIYSAFGLFDNPDIDGFRNDDWYARTKERADFDVTSINPEDPKSLQRLVLLAPSFSTIGGVSPTWDSFKRTYVHSSPQRFENIIRQATLIELAQTRDKKYKSYYNSPTPTGT